MAIYSWVCVGSAPLEVHECWEPVRVEGVAFVCFEEGSTSLAVPLWTGGAYLRPRHVGSTWGQETKEGVHVAAAEPCRVCVGVRWWGC